MKRIWSRAPDPVNVVLDVFYEERRMRRSADYERVAGKVEELCRTMMFMRDHKDY
jgi:hypothetical protein